MPRIVYDGEHDGPTNMARDIALTERGEICGRVYGWNEPWVTLGKFQSPNRLHAGNRVPTINRPTGGAAVLHGHDVTFAICYPLLILEGAKNRNETFRQLKWHFNMGLHPVVEALNACGVASVLRQDSVLDFNRQLEWQANLGEADCFGVVRPCDIVEPQVTKKICGVAALETRDFILFQGSIPTGEPRVDPGQVFRRPAEPFVSAISANAFCDALNSTLDTYWPEE